MTSEARDHQRARRAAAAQLFGTGVGPLASDARVAARLMAGTLLLAPHGEVPLGAEPPWSADPFQDRNWGFQLHCLLWADPLRREGERTSDGALLDRHRTILRSWVESNPVDEPPSPFSWADMATGRRVLVLAGAVSTHGALPWLLDAMGAHGTVLARPGFGAVRGNHALHVHAGLLVAGAVLAREDWLDLAVGRLDDLRRTSFDDEGINREGAIGYQGLNLRWFDETRRRIVAAGRPSPASFDQVGRIAELLEHATLPDGTYEAIGDTGIANPRSWVPDAAAPSAERPVHRVYNAGYLFARSGWGGERDASDETFYSLRFGGPRSHENHGHEDQGSLTLYAHGQRLLFDAGLYRYGSSARQRHVASRRAHNVVDVLGATYRDDVGARLVATEHTPGRDVTTVAVTAMAGTSWLRTVLYSRTGDYLLVHDRLSHLGDVTSVQRWNLPTGRTVRVDRDAVLTSGPGPNVVLCWAGPTRLDVVEGDEERMLGWRAPRYGVWLPSPVAQATTRGRTTDLTVVVVPVPAGREAPAVGVAAEATGGVLRVTVTVGDRTEVHELALHDLPAPELPPTEGTRSSGLGRGRLPGPGRLARRLRRVAARARRALVREALRRAPGSIRPVRGPAR